MFNFLKTAKERIEGGKYTEAVQVLESVPERRRSDPGMQTEIYYLTALCRYRLKEYAKAANDLEAALDTAAKLDYADKRHVYELLWKVYRESLDYVKLKEFSRQLLDHGGDKKNILNALLDVYNKLKKWVYLAETLDEFCDVELDANPLLCKILCFTKVYRIKEALQAAREYAVRFGEDAKFCECLVPLYYYAGDAERGLEYYKKAVAKNDDPKWQLSINSFLLAQDIYYGAISDREFPAIIADMRRSSERLQTGRNFDNTPKPFRKLRLGYMSANLGPHPVGYFLMPVMMNTVNSHSFIKCYSLFSPDIALDDGSIIMKFRTAPDAWVDVEKLPDEQIERMFLDDKIDMAFDMMSHSENHRLRLFARRLAPVQISWIGYPVTTAVAAMDYVIADRCTIPPGAEKYYTEKLLYMPDHYLCHTLTGVPRLEAPAFTRNGHVTFACFHNFRKITDDTLRMWRRILERTENSTLKVMGRLPKSKEGREMIEERFRKNGMPMNRVSIFPDCGITDYLAAYNGVDIMLDTWPFSGATTTFDALWMGRPIITLAGERHVTRVSYSILRKIGFEELAAFTEDEYVEKAVGLANDPDRLLRICGELPGRLMDSPLTDQNAFRKNYEKIIRDAWVAYCADNRADYDYGADSLPELLEQVTNATVWFERKLEAGEPPDIALVNEYHMVQKAFYEKLKPTTDNENFIHGYGKLVDMIGLACIGFDAEKLRRALITTRRFLNMFSKGTL